MDVDIYSAGELIEKGSHIVFGTDRRVNKNIRQQEILVDQVNEIVADNNRDFLLVGHFCLVDQAKKIYRIPEDIFIRLQIDKIIVLIQDSYVLKKRNNNRKSLDETEKFYNEFQEMELSYAKEIASIKAVPILITEPTNINGICQFIKE